MSVLEESPFGLMRVIATPTSATVTIIARGKSVATISADFVELLPSVWGWWINRALVTDPATRGAGIGTFVLKRLKRAVEAVSEVRVFLVSPGGYTNDTDRQFRFYTKNGFRAVEGSPDLLELRGRDL
jgi:GNAT superfamily N-acetyltransferase